MKLRTNKNIMPILVGPSDTISVYNNNEKVAEFNFESDLIIDTIKLFDVNNEFDIINGIAVVLGERST